MEQRLRWIEVMDRRQSTRSRVIAVILVILVILAMLSLQGCFVLRRKQVDDLKARAVTAQAEMRRLEYVRLYGADLYDQSVALRGAIEKAAALKGVDPATPTPRAHLDPTKMANLRAAARSMAYVPSSRPSVEELQGWLDELNMDIQTGINLEKKLPGIEADLLALKERLAVIEAGGAARR